MDKLELLADLYGPPAQHTEYQRGDKVAWMERGQRITGEVIYVVAATEGKLLTYVVSPDIEIFPVELAAHELIV